MTELLKTVIVNEGGEPVATLEGSTYYTNGQAIGTQTAVHLDYTADEDELQKRKYYKDGKWHNRINKPSDYHDWTNYAWVWNSDKYWEEVKSWRSHKLILSDWTVMVDSPLSDSKKTEWATYRQALRNVPATNSSITVLADVVWPTEPT